MNAMLTTFEPYQDATHPSLGPGIWTRPTTFLLSSNTKGCEDSP